MFYFWDGTVFVAPKNDIRSHKEFIDDPDIYNKCIRGYYRGKKLVLYTGGDDFSEVNISELTAVSSTIIEALNIPIGVSVYNGVKPGKIGAIWEPIHCFDIV